MKYTITINQLGLYYAGLNFKTDWNDWAIIDYLKDFAIHQKSKRIYVRNEPRPSRINNQSNKSNLPKYAHNSQNGILTTEGRGEEYVWLNYNHLITNLPFAKFQGKWTVSRRIAKLRRLGLIKTYRAKDNTLYVAFTDKLIDICWAKRTDIEKMRKIAQTTGHSEASTKESLTKVIHNLPAPIADKSHRGYCTANATAQIETKYPIETKNNKDISFSYSLKPKNRKPQINRDEHRFSNRYTSPLTGEDKGEGERNYNTPHPNLLPQGAKELNTQKIELQISRDYNRNPINPVRKEVKGFKTFSIV